MSGEDRGRLLLVVDTALALSSVEIGNEPRTSWFYPGSPPDVTTDGLTFHVNHNDAALFGRPEDPLIQDPMIRQLLQAALPDLEDPHGEFVRRLSTDSTELDLELDRRGLTGTGLDLKEGGQRSALSEYRHSKNWLKRRKWFRSMLKWTDIVLGSLSSIPGFGVAVDPMKEWKESVEAQLDAESGPRRRK